MSGKAARISLSEKQLYILQRIIRSTTASQRLVQRVRVILFGFDGWQNQDIADEVKLHRRQVGLWRRRWQESFDGSCPFSHRLRFSVFFVRERAASDHEGDAFCFGGGKFSFMASSSS